MFTAAPDYSEITNPNLTTVNDDNSGTITGINDRRLLSVRADFDWRFAGCEADWTAVYFT